MSKETIHTPCARMTFSGPDRKGAASVANSVVAPTVGEPLP